MEVGPPTCCKAATASGCDGLPSLLSGWGSLAPGRAFCGAGATFCSFAIRSWLCCSPRWAGCVTKGVRCHQSSVLPQTSMTRHSSGVIVSGPVPHYVTTGCPGGQAEQLLLHLPAKDRMGAVWKAETYHRQLGSSLFYLPSCRNLKTLGKRIVCHQLCRTLDVGYWPQGKEKGLRGPQSCAAPVGMYWW